MKDGEVELFPIKSKELIVVKPDNYKELPEIPSINIKKEKTMDKYIKMTDWNEIVEKKKAGECFAKGDSGYVLAADYVLGIRVNYYKLNPDFDAWVELDINKWKEWDHQCIGKKCEVLNHCNWRPEILKGFDICSDSASFRGEFRTSDQCRVKKSLLEVE